MNIEVGQIWSRKPTGSRHFPKRGWKVEILEVKENSVVHKVIEYNGRVYEMPPEETVLALFLERYELEA